MTVKRQGEATFSVDKARLVEHTRAILAGNPIYKNTREGVDGRIITGVKPGFFLASTPMTISFEQVGENTTVKVSTTSEAFIIGDRWGYYNRYIRDFLEELKRVVR